MSATMLGWLRITMSKDIFNRSLKVGLVVGTILTLINFGDQLLQGVITPAMLWKIPMTYCVPFCVSTYASVTAVRKDSCENSRRD